MYAFTPVYAFTLFYTILSDSDVVATVFDRYNTVVVVVVGAEKDSSIDFYAIKKSLTCKVLCYGFYSSYMHIEPAGLLRHTETS